jgi:hypothetical protein
VLVDDGYRVCGGCEGAAGPVHAKTSSPGRKMVPGPFHGGDREAEGEETSGSKNETRLVVAGPPGREPGGLSSAWQAARCGVCCCAGLKAADSNHLVPQPNSDGEGVGVAAQNCVGAVLERLKGWNDAAPMDLDKGRGEQLAGQVDARILPRQRRSRNMQGFGKIFDHSIN